VNDEYQPVTAAEVTDEKLVAGELRAFRAEVRLYFERLIMRLDRFEGRITSLEVHRTDANARLDQHEHRIAALEAALPKP